MPRFIASWAVTGTILSFGWDYGIIRSIPSFRSILKLAGKGESRVVAVFGYSPAFCHLAVIHVRKGASGVPVWLFATTAPLPETVALCDRVFVRRNSVALMAEALWRTWPVWVALSVAPWTGGHGRWALKLGPFLIPPFRVLLVNDSGDFFSGTPGEILRHLGHRARDAADSVWNGLRILAHAAGDVRRDAVHWAGGMLVNLRLPVQFVLGSRWLGHPHCRMFHRLHGTDRLDVGVVDEGGDGVVRFTQTGTRWDAEELERAARGSTARWILWKDDTAPSAGMDDLLLASEDAFAVSRQAHFRAWKPMMIPAAAFRTLQKGEVSQVLAPVSHTILVDRAKLLALGIPRTALSGTAWMIVFWKAAAAGWRSYSVGQGGELKEQPDFPMQEIGFLFRLLGDRELRRLGPREAELSRGAVARGPGLRQDRPGGLSYKVLVVSPFLPFPLSHGGAVRIYNLCRALADRVDFVLVALREKHDFVDYEELHEVFREVHVVDIDERASKNMRLPGQVRGHQSAALRALIADLVRTRRPDLMQIEYTHMAGFRDAAPDVAAILVEHDLTFKLYRQLPDDAEYQRWLAFEQQWLRAYDGVWTVSEDDRETVVRDVGRDAATTFMVPNGVDIARFTPVSEATEHPEIFYVGSFRHLPNVLGLQVLMREIMPRVWKRFAGARLRVVAGPQHTTFWKGPLPSDPRIEIHGFVEDLRPLYARAAVVAVPLEVSAGTNIKVLEAMACGKAVVSTPVGCAGLGVANDADAMIRAGWDEFAAAICELLADPALRARIGLAARRTTEDHFSWTAIANAAFDSYTALHRTGIPV